MFPLFGWGNGLDLFHFSALWEFLLGGYSGRGERQRGGDGDAGGVEQSADVVARLRNLMIGRSSADADFGDAQAGEAVESFPNRQVAVAPAPPEFLRHQIGQHDDDGMAARAVLGAQIDRPHFQMHRFAVAERPFDLGQVFVTIVYDLLRYDGFGQIGAQGVATIEAGQFGQGVLVNSQGHGASYGGDPN